MILPNLRGAAAVDALCKKARDCPEDLSPDEIEVVREYDRGFDLARAIQDKRLREYAAEARKPQPAKPAAPTSAFRGWVKGSDNDTLCQWLDKNGDLPVPASILSGIMEHLLTFIKEMNDNNAKRNKKIAALETRCAELETRIEGLTSRGMKYCGVFDANTRYEPGDVVSRSGSAWYCKMPGLGIAPAEDTPMATAMWQLMVKRGRDGKDR